MADSTIAWLFPGQGSQSVGMGKALFDASPAARRVFEAADDALDEPISKLCFDGPQDQLTLTANAQPAIVTTSIAALEALREAVGTLPSPLMAAGHSLGEYSALVAAGSFELADAVRLVRLRGEAMQEAVAPGEGAMAAILKGDPEQVDGLCTDAAEGETVSAANFNAPGQIVIAGHAGAVKRATALAKERKLRAIPLKVSAPFHCSLMAPAAKRVDEALGSVALKPLAFPVVANVDATPNEEAARVPDLLVQQVDHPVRWEQSIQAMAEAGVRHALELGAGKVLEGLVRKIDERIEVIGVGDPDGIDRARALYAD